ncbi:MAG: DUF4845 domain-containing protein [Burkholderiales bacterium]
MKTRGLSMIGFLFVIVVVGFLVVFLFKLIPAYVEYFSIKNALSAMARDSELQNASPQAIRSAFSRRVQIDDIKAIEPADIGIEKDGGNLVLSTSYSKRVPIIGHFNACLDFSITTAGK